MPFGFVIKAVPARVGYTANERKMAVPIAAIAIAIGSVHRAAGFVWPYHVWFREYEKYRIGMWAPSSIEHLVGALG